MDVTWTTAAWWFAALTAALLVCRLLATPRCSAPRVPGLPILGSALALGRWGAAFLSVCRSKIGPDAFLLHVGFGQRMLFLFHPALIETFFKAAEEVVSFKPAVRRFTQRCEGGVAWKWGG